MPTRVAPVMREVLLLVAVAVEEEGAVELEFDGGEDVGAGVATLGNDSGWEEIDGDGTDASESPVDEKTGLAGSGLDFGVGLGDGDGEDLDWGS